MLINADELFLCRPYVGISALVLGRLNWLDLYLSFEHVESINSDSYVRSWARLCIALRCQSCLNTFYIVYELENEVNIIEHFNKFYTQSYAMLSDGTWLHVMLYICMAHLVYTTVPVNCWYFFLKKNCPFLAITWQSIRSLGLSPTAVCWYPPLTSFSFYPNFTPFACFKFMMPL